MKVCCYVRANRQQTIQCLTLPICFYRADGKPIVTCLMFQHKSYRFSNRLLTAKLVRGLLGNRQSDACALDQQRWCLDESLKTVCVGIKLRSKIKHN